MNRAGRFRHYVLGVDLGGTHCRAALFSTDGEMGPRLERRLADAEGGGETEAFFRVLDEVLAGESRSGLAAVGIGSFGPIDKERRQIEEAPNRPAWRRVPLRALVEERYGVPVVLENDANVAAFGEYLRGAGRGVESLLGLTLGTGIGGGFVLRGEILVGAGGMAGEVGHVYVGGEGVRCRCGAIDCLEAYASAEGIKRLYRVGAGPVRDLSCHGIFHLARKGEERALETIGTGARLLGLGIASLQKVLDPERIVIGGGLAREWDLFVRPAIRTARENVFASQRARLDVVVAALGTDAGLVGAAELARNLVVSR